MEPYSTAEAPGGMMGAMVEDAAVTAAEKGLSQPCSSMASVSILPMPETSDTAEPDMPATIMPVNTFTWARPPAGAAPWCRKAGNLDAHVRAGQGGGGHYEERDGHNGEGVQAVDGLLGDDRGVAPIDAQQQNRRQAHGKRRGGTPMDTRIISIKNISLPIMRPSLSGSSPPPVTRLITLTIRLYAENTVLSSMAVGRPA